MIAMDGASFVDNMFMLRLEQSRNLLGKLEFLKIVSYHLNLKIPNLSIYFHRSQHCGISFASMSVELQQKNVEQHYLSFAWQQNHLLQFLVLTCRTLLI